jgi:hypothetical protein
MPLNLFIVRSEEIERSRFNALVGLVDQDRIDEELYGDFETEKSKEVSSLTQFQGATSDNGHISSCDHHII